MILDYFQFIFALLLIWLRGYILVYLIDRSKSMSFGFKFFVGWMLGLGGFTLDVFSANIFNGLRFQPWVFYVFAFAQMFGFGFMVLIFERKLPYPNIKRFIPFVHKHWTSFLSWNVVEKIAMVFLLITLASFSGVGAWRAANTLEYGESVEAKNLRAETIYVEQVIPNDKSSTTYLGGSDINAPLHDVMLKVWVSIFIGDFQGRYINLMGIFYYLVLVAVFYHALPKIMNRLIKILATYILSVIPLLFIHSFIPYIDFLFGIYLLLAGASLFYYLIGSGNSFYYLSGMGLAFSVWTKNEGLTILFPIFLVLTLAVLAAKKVKLKDFLLSWFFAILTVAAWLSFMFIKKIDFLSGSTSIIDFVLNVQFIPLIIFFIAFFFHKIFDKLK